MDLRQAFERSIRALDLHSGRHRLLLAVSGGVDSVVMTDLFAAAGFDFIIAHVNFGLRGDESDAETMLVEELGKRYGRPVHVRRIDARRYAEELGLSIQLAARQFRYQWFGQLRLEAGTILPLTHIVTAHHQDDNIETVLMQFFRGTGLAGLRGIPERNGDIIRPLLFATKRQLRDYAVQRALPYAEDSSNAQDKYTRNAVRLHILPEIRKVFPEIDATISAAIPRYAELGQIVQDAVEAKRAKLFEARGQEVAVPVRKLLALQPLPTYLYELFRPFGFTAAQQPDLLQLLQADTGKYMVSDTHRVLRNRAWLLVTPLHLQRPSAQTLAGIDADVVFGEYTLTQRELDWSDKHAIDTAANVALIDAKYVHYPLLLRPWKKGDYFYPLGMRKKKKIARFLIDQKLSANDKEKVCVLESKGRILWLVGMRIDDRCKITGSTKKVIRFEWKKFPGDD